MLMTPLELIVPTISTPSPSKSIIKTSLLPLPSKSPRDCSDAMIRESRLNVPKIPSVEFSNPVIITPSSDAGSAVIVTLKLYTGLGAKADTQLAT